MLMVNGAKFVSGPGVNTCKIIDAGNNAGESAVAVVHFCGDVLSDDDGDEAKKVISL